MFEKAITHILELDANRHTIKNQHQQQTHTARPRPNSKTCWTRERKCCSRCAQGLEWNERWVHRITGSPTPLRAGNPSKSYLRIWAGNPESVVPGSALIRFCVQDSHSHNPLLGRKSRVSRAFYLGCWAGNRVSYLRFCAGQPE